MGMLCTVPTDTPRIGWGHAVVLKASFHLDGFQIAASSGGSPPPKVARVAIVQEAVFHYRQRFYELLRERLRADGIELVLVHSNDPVTEDVWDSAVQLPWSHRVPMRRLQVGRRELLWQPCWDVLRDCDLVIVEQGSRHLLNYLLLAEQLIGRRKVALWGHGRNFNTADASALGEFAKARWSRLAHWWFAYNQRSAEIVAELGVAQERITVLNNTVDTLELRRDIAATSPEELEQTKEQLGITGDHTALYLGGLAPEKRLDYLFAASDVIRSAVPDFVLIVAGSGPEASKVSSYAATRPWVRVVGATRGEEKAHLLAVAQVLVMPAAAGLVVLDAFAAGVPIAVSAQWEHGPEVDYIEDGNNGVVVDDDRDPSRFGSAVAELLLDASYRSALRDGSLAAAHRYSLEAMVDNFATGVGRALAS
jgi:L-malate glycosyltransferase